MVDCSLIDQYAEHEANAIEMVRSGGSGAAAAAAAQGPGLQNGLVRMLVMALFAGDCLQVCRTSEILSYPRHIIFN